MRLAFRFPARPLLFLLVAALACAVVGGLALVRGSIAPVDGGLPFSAPQQNQQKLTVEPEPSYRPDAVSVRRHPEVDTDVFLYINHGRNSAPRIGHGGLIERDILTPGDPLHPPKKGAVLKYITSYMSATLEARTNTRPTKSAAEQTFLYVTSGTGTIEAAAKKSALADGTAVFIPAGLEYRLTNPGDHHLQMIFVTEAIAPGFQPQAGLSVGTAANSPPAVGHHWAHVARAILYDVPPKFSNPMGFALVSIDSFDIAQPHVHGPGTEEIWCQLTGTSLLFFGNRLLRQSPGEAFLIPPNNKVPHASINPTGEPMSWLYMGCQHPEDMEKRP